MDALESPLGHPRITRDGNLQFVTAASHKTVASLSRPVVRLLVALANAGSGTLARAEIHRAVYIRDVTATGRYAPLSPAQRATLSRSLRRLRELEIVEEREKGQIGLTADGLRLVEWLTTRWSGWPAFVSRYPADLAAP